MQLKIRKGLNLPVTGQPLQTIASGPDIRTVALTGADYAGLKPRLLVKVGDSVRLGQPLFIDKCDPDICYAAPGAGTISAIHRGARRTLQSIIIDLHGDDQETFDACASDKLHQLSQESVRTTLQTSGLWTGLRARPFNHVAHSDAQPDALFVTAIDTNPLAADPVAVINDAAEPFADGLTVLRRLTDSPIYLCQAEGGGIAPPPGLDMRVAEFKGPHPAGLVGTHIHFLDPVRRGKSVWHINYQDVIAIGRLFTSGRIPIERIVALGGARVKQPRLLRTRRGANTDELVHDELLPGPTRVVSGSLLNGRHAAGWARYLGRYHLGVAAIAEPEEREFMGWFVPGFRKFSANRLYVSHLIPGRKFNLNTSLQGSPRAIVPVGHFERVMPLDLLATPLLKALVIRDTGTAESLGCLELDEEDLSLCSLVCCSKQDYGAALRACLEQLERDC